MQPTRPGVLAQIAPLAVYLGLWSAWIGWHNDDAGITYAYAQNLADGLGFRPFAASGQVEGFSNPTWMLLLSATVFGGAPVALASKAWQLVLGLTAVALVAPTARRWGATHGEAGIAGLVAAVSVPFVLWSASGLETALVAALFVAAAFLRSAGPLPIGLVAGLLAASRPEGPLLAAGTLAMWAGGRDRRDVALAAVVAAALPGAWLVVRLLVFHAWWPNTAPAKLDPDPWRRLARGAWYLAVSAPVAGGLLVAGLAPPERRRAIGLVGAVWLAALVTGGDWMRHARWFAPLLPALCAVAVPALIRRPWGRGLVAAHLVAQAIALPRAIHPPLPEAVVARIGAVLEDAAATAWQEPLTVASPDVGGLLDGHPDRVVVDLAGLVDRQGALHGRDPGYWAERVRSDAPRFVVLHTLWTERTGLTAEVLATLDYTRVCSQHKVVRGATHTLDLYARGEVPSGTLERLLRWCDGPP